MRFLYAFIIVIMLPFFVTGQDLQGIDTNVVLNKVSRNFFLFRVLNAKEYITSYLSKDGYLSFAGDVHFLNYLPPYGCELEISLRKRNDKFPDTSFVMFEVVKKLGLYLCDKVVLDGKLFPFEVDRRMLIAVNKRTNQVIFISGNFFLQDIRNYFNFKNGVEDFQRYLKFRYFMYGVDEAVFIKRRKNHFSFEGKDSTGKLIGILDVEVKQSAISHVDLKLY
ncbi:MAG: hypothetical protein EOP48_12100 [Sphingobacteriales bacterium]|nr:MAG: hypothetical protein EOP48_12100 [Sphingobacteriales bacterium]